MCERFRSIGWRIVTVLVFSLACLSYSRADNILSGSGALPTMTFSFNATRSTGGGSIQNFGPNSLNGAILQFSDSFSSYSEAPLPNGLTGVSATIGSGSISLGLVGPANYSFFGQIYSGNMDGYYCKPFASCCCQHVNGLVETTVYFSGKWMIPHFPQPEFWPGQGHFYVVEQHAYGSWVNGCNLVLNGCGKPPSTIWIDTQIPGATPEPNTLVLLGTSLVGLAGVLRRKQS